MELPTTLDLDTFNDRCDQCGKVKCDMGREWCSTQGTEREEEFCHGHGHKPLVEEKPSPEQTERWEEVFKRLFVVYGHPMMGSPMMFNHLNGPSSIIKFIQAVEAKAEARGRVAGMTEIGRKCLGAIHHAKYGKKIGCVCCDAILTVLQDNGVEIKSDGV